MKKILCLDPGGTTGAVIINYDDDSYQIAEGWQIKGGLKGFIDFYWDTLSDIKFDSVICESFELREGIYGADLSPTYIIGAVEALNIVGAGDIVYQTPSQKPLVSDDRLRRLNAYESGRPHANDARRHGIIYLRNKKHKAILKEGWGD